MEFPKSFTYLIINQRFLIELERPSQIADTNLLRINRIEAITSPLIGIEISARSGSQFVLIKQIVGIPKMTHSRRAVYSFCRSTMITISDNPVRYLIPPRYVCKVDNFLFNIAASLLGRRLSFPIFCSPLKSLNL